MTQPAHADEEAEFAKGFKAYYQHNQLPIAELIDNKKQELLTKMI